MGTLEERNISTLVSEYIALLGTQVPSPAFASEIICEWAQTTTTAHLTMSIYM